LFVVDCHRRDGCQQVTRETAVEVTAGKRDQEFGRQNSNRQRPRAEAEAVSAATGNGVS